MDEANAQDSAAIINVSSTETDDWTPAPEGALAMLRAFLTGWQEGGGPLGMVKFDGRVMARVLTTLEQAEGRAAHYASVAQQRRGKLRRAGERVNDLLQSVDLLSERLYKAYRLIAGMSLRHLQMQAEHRVKVREMQKRLEETEANAQSTIHRHERHLFALEERVAYLHTRREEAYRDRSDALDEAARLRKKLAWAVKDGDEARAEVAQVCEKYLALVERNKELEPQLAYSQTTVADRDKEIEVLRLRINSLVGEKDELCEQVQALHGNLAATQAEVVRLRTELRGAAQRSHDRFTKLAAEFEKVRAQHLCEMRMREDLQTAAQCFFDTGGGGGTFIRPLLEALADANKWMPPVRTEQERRSDPPAAAVYRTTDQADEAAACPTAADNPNQQECKPEPEPATDMTPAAIRRMARVFYGPTPTGPWTEL